MQYHLVLAACTQWIFTSFRRKNGAMVIYSQGNSQWDWFLGRDVSRWHSPPMTPQKDCHFSPVMTTWCQLISIPCTVFCVWLRPPPHFSFPQQLNRCTETFTLLLYFFRSLGKNPTQAELESMIKQADKDSKDVKSKWQIFTSSQIEIKVLPAQRHCGCDGPHGCRPPIHGWNPRMQVSVPVYPLWVTWPHGCYISPLSVIHTEFTPLGMSPKISSPHECKATLDFAQPQVTSPSSQSMHGSDLRAYH